MTEGRRRRGAARALRDGLGETLRRCVSHSIDTQSAAIAFYTLFAFAPALLLAVAIARRFFSEGEVRLELVRKFQDLMGRDGGLAVAALLEKATGPGVGGGPAGIPGVAALVLGTMAVFIQLQEALNQVWEVAPRPGTVFGALLRKRLLSFVIVLAAGVLLLVSLVLSAGLLALTDYLTTEIPLRVTIVALGNEVLSFLVVGLLIALVYRVLPDAQLEWRDVALGAALTSLLFSAGKWLIGLYLARPTAASQVGIAGSLVVVLMWLYYESTIFLFGAEVTAVLSSRRRGHPPAPEPGAASVAATIGPSPP